MNDIHWKAEYMINNPVIDKEHKHLFDIAAEAFKPVLPDEKKKKIRSIIIELNEYMKIHFQHEESFMRLIDYPNLPQHEIIHHNIIESMQTMLASLATIPIKQFEKDLAVFIDTALVNHIRLEDQKIQDFYRGKEDKRHHIDWNKAYLIGNEQIDKDHQALFEIANKAFSLLGKSEHRQELKETIVKLFTYIREHFEHEEKLMQDINYPSYEQHYSTHQKIITEMNELIKTMPTSDIQTFELELAIFIEKSLVQHVIYEDRKVKAYIKPADSEIIEL